MTQIAFLAAVFLIAVVITYFLLSQLMPTAAQKRLEAVTESGGAPALAAGEPKLLDRLARVLHPLAKPSLPKEEWEKSPLRVRFFNAGFRSANAPIVFFAVKTLLTFVLPGALAIYVGMSAIDFNTQMLLAALLLLAAIGYYLPNAVLAYLIRHRQRELFENFPDALDLMRICVEAGLGLDAAIERVGSEMSLKSPALSEELHLVSLELRAGASRADALRNLALRVGLEDVDALVAMLVQADRFGTSIAESLRVHSTSLRVKRRLIAEETAAKVPVKIVFPLIFCIFPALFVVLLGPAAIRIYRVLFATLFR